MRHFFPPFPVVLLLTSFAICVSCRKTDHAAPSAPDKIVVQEDRFFTAHRSSDPVEHALVDFVKKKNEKEHFVEAAISRIGYPRWDKTVAVIIPAVQSRGNTDSSVTIYYIPFVRDSDNYVNASMLIRSTPGDTALSYKCNWQYNTLQNNNNSISDSTEYFAAFFMVLDKSVFGHSRFTITDTNLFRGANHKPLYVTLDSSATAGRGSLFVPVQRCQTITISYQSCPWNDAGQPCAGSNGTCDNCTRCTAVQSFQYCWEEYVDDGSGTGLPPGNGGSGGSGGGSTPPSCGTPPAAMRGTVQSCDAGWTPSPSPTLTQAQIAILGQLNHMAALGDQFYFQNGLNPAQSLSFSSVSYFQNYLQTTEAGQTFDLTTPTEIINQNEKIEHAKFNLTFIGGIDISCKLNKNGNTWQLINITSADYGVTIGWSWEQLDYAQTISGNEITVLVEGYVRYNVIIDGWGTIYKSKKKFQIKINNQTGQITSIAKI